jgi:hypothetical protein
MRSAVSLDIEAAYAEHPKHLGVRVGKLCVDGGVPLAIVAGITGVTMVSVYRYVKGLSSPNTRSIVTRMKRLEFTLTKAIEQGILPTTTFNPDILLPLWRQSKLEVK